MVAVTVATLPWRSSALHLQAKAREEAAKREQQQQPQQQQPAAAAAAAPSAGISPASADPHLKSTAAAVEYEQLLQLQLSEAEAAAAEITSRPELKQQRRTLEKQITMAVSQISGTQQQVGGVLLSGFGKRLCWRMGFAAPQGLIACAYVYAEGDL
jgi:hypothetical protein